MQGKNYIDGKWVESLSGQTFNSINPAHPEEVLGVFPRSNERDVDLAVGAAKSAFSMWKRWSRIKRGECFDNFTQLIKADKEELARLIARESGKTWSESLADVIEGIHMCQYVFGTVRMPYGEIVSSEIAEKDAFMRRRPKGVVAAISPWNFPFAIPLWLIAPSLVEGNTVVLKPSEDTPLVAQKIAEYMEKAGFPPGSFNLIQGFGEEAGRALVAHSGVDVVLFTGSYEVGSEIRRICAESNKMAACEMGGKNAVIVCDDADLNLAVNAALISCFKTSGQRCTSASRLIVHESILSDFQKAFLEGAKNLTLGEPLEGDTFMGPLINEAGLRKVEFYNRLAAEEGGEILLEGQRLKKPGLESGYFLTPHIYRMGHNGHRRVLTEEVFGPHVAIIPFRTLDEAITVYNSTPYGLALSVITEDIRKARMIREECDYGVGYVNLPTIGAEVHLPFGGVKQSGTGLPSASTLIDAVTHRTAWTVNYSRVIKMAQGLTVDVSEAKKVEPILETVKV